MRFIGVIIVLILSNMMVSYNLMANYFEVNKYPLFVKKINGHSFTKRHRLFLIGFTNYTGFILFVTTLLVMRGATIGGWMTLNPLVLLFLLAFILIDMLMIVSFERHFAKKSLAEALKGER